VNYPSLNRRYKVGLFLVIVTTGLALFLDATLKQTAGIVLLGLAATWLVGSLSLRVLWAASSIVACGAGIVIGGKPILDNWQNYRVSAQDHKQAVADLRAAVASSEPEIDSGKYTVESPAQKSPDWFERNAPKVQSPSAPSPKRANTGVFGKDEPLPAGAVEVRDQPSTEGTLVFDDGKWRFSDWRDVGRSYRTTKVPGTVAKVERPCAELPTDDPPPQVNPANCFVVERVSFAADKKTEEVISTLVDQLLEVQPTFSIWESFVSRNRGSSIVGVGFLLAGIAGLTLMRLRLAFLAGSGSAPLS
jgi:hypothetical protein